MNPDRILVRAERHRECRWDGGLHQCGTICDFANGVLFNAIPNATADALLSAAPVAAFGFLGSNPAAIAVQGSTLAVQPGQSTFARGWEPGVHVHESDTGDIGSVPAGVTMTGGKLSAPGGQINLVSVASAGEILSSASLQLGANVNGQAFTSLGNIID